MKSFTKITLALMILFSSTSAQSFKAGTNIFQGGIGFISLYFETSYDPWKTVVIPPLSITYEVGTSNKFSLGFYYGLNTQDYSEESYSYSIIGNNAYKNYYPNVIWTHNKSVSLFCVRGSFHCFISDKLDPYYGAMSGIQITHYTSSSTDPNFPYPAYSSNQTAFALGLYLGAKYYFMNHFGVYSEIDLGGIGVINVGIVGKL